MDKLNEQDSPATPRQGFDSLGTGGAVNRANQQDFQDAWERHAAPVATSRERENSIATT